MQNRGSAHPYPPPESRERGLGVGLAGGLAAIRLIAGVAGFLFADRQEAAVGADADDGLGAAAFIDAEAVEFLAVAAAGPVRFDGAIALLGSRVEDGAGDIAPGYGDGAFAGDVA